MFFCAKKLNALKISEGSEFLFALYQLEKIKVVPNIIMVSENNVIA